MDGSDTQFRAKLYGLSEEAKWDDVGTGHVFVIGEQDRKRHSKYLIFRDEESDEVLLKNLVFPDVYQLSGDAAKQSIIIWEDPETEKDWAISFEEPDAAKKMYMMLTLDDSIESRVLPLPKVDNLNELSAALQCVPPAQREHFARECGSSVFISALREAFHSVEELDNKDSLKDMFHIAKGMFMLSNATLTLRLLRQDIYEDVFGMLEYDDGIGDKQIKHRSVMKEKVTYKQVLTIEDAFTVEKIHLNFRLQYLKDVILPRIFDDAGFALMAQLISTNTMTIVEFMRKSPSGYLEQLFSQVNTNDTESLCFLQELCRSAKIIALPERQALYEKMSDGMFFEVLKPYLNTPSQNSAPGTPCSCAVAIEILVMSVTHHPAHLRRFISADHGARGKSLLSRLSNLLLLEEDQGLQSQLADILKSVMDASTLERGERDSFLDVFYDGGIFNQLIRPIREYSPVAKTYSQAQCFSLQLVCEIMAYAVTQHGHRSRTYMMKECFPQNALRLMASSHRFLHLAPLRLIRALIGTKNNEVFRYVVKHSLLAPVMCTFQQSLQQNCGGSLFVSSTLELLELVRAANLKMLVNYICSKHNAILVEFQARYKTLEGLLLVHQQNMENMEYATNGGILGELIGVRRRSPNRGDSDDDQAYFDSEDDENTYENISLPPDQRKSQEKASQPNNEGIKQQQKIEAPSPAKTATLTGLLGSYDEDDEDVPADTPAPAIVELSRPISAKSFDEGDDDSESPDRISLKGKPDENLEGLNVNHVSKRLKKSP